MIDELKTDYKDDVLATSQQGKRTFNIVGKNGEILFEDVHIEDTSRYLQVGDEYGQRIINEQNGAINQLAKGTGYVFDTYAEYLEAYQGGEIPVGAIVYIKEGSVDGTITALQVKYNDSNVKLALDSLSNTKLAKSGGTMTGALNFANNIWNQVGDDVFIGDKNQSGCLCIKSTRSHNSGIAFLNNAETVGTKIQMDDDGQLYAQGEKIISQKVLQFGYRTSGTILDLVIYARNRQCLFSCCVRGLSDAPDTTSEWIVWCQGQSGVGGTRLLVYAQAYTSGACYHRSFFSDSWANNWEKAFDW